MKISTIDIQGPKIIVPDVYKDDRGYFCESYNKQRFIDVGIDYEFVQDNQSLSQKGALRGLHYQAPPQEQGKLVRVVNGSVLDVIVDIRKDSPTYGSHYSVELNEENMIMLWIPPGFAHGFSTLADNTLFQYKCSALYHKLSEGGILWNDPELNISWQVDHPIVSEKDKLLPFLKDFKSPF